MIVSRVLCGRQVSLGMPKEAGNGEDIAVRDTAGQTVRAWA